MPRRGARSSREQGRRVPSRSADEALVTTFFHAWRRNQANRQAAEWLEERTEARVAVAQAPAEIRERVGELVDALIEGAAGGVEPALNELWDLLADRPDLRERFARLGVVADAIDFVKQRTDPGTSGVRPLSGSDPTKTGPTKAGA